MNQSRNHSIKWLVLISISVILFLAAIASLTFHHKRIPLTLSGGVLLTSPHRLDSFALMNDHDAPFTNQQLMGKWNFIFFGFTHCPMLCPTTLAELNKAYEILASQHITPLPQVVFISIDPERDSSSRIRHYLIQFNRNFVGATGTKEQLSQLTKRLGIVYMKATKSNDHNYDIEHSGNILLINPQGQLAAILDTSLDGTSIANNFVQLLKISSGSR